MTHTAPLPSSVHTTPPKARPLTNQADKPAQLRPSDADLNRVEREPCVESVAFVRPLKHLTHDGAWRLAVLHDRPQAHLFWITKGQGTLILDGVKQGLSGHTVIYVPKGALFALTTTPGVFGTVVGLRDEHARYMPTKPVALRVIDMGEQRSFAAHFDNLSREINTQSEGQDVAVMAHAMLTSVWLARQTLSQNATKPSAKERIMSCLFETVSEHFAEGQGIGAIADRIGVTPTHLSRLCNATLGLSSSKLLADRIFYEARALLADTRLTASDISKQLGFSSPAYFTRAFQAHVGQTPSAFRAEGAQISKVA
ncbi:MAG: AraC family transcriptional regulator [Pseudomonadota bacterium]